MNEYYAIPTIRLTYGEGSRGKAACWMSALSVFVGEKWTDKLECVDPVINKFCIKINDMFGSGKAADDARSRVILPILFEPLGTVGTEEDRLRRVFILVDASVRIFSPLALEIRGRHAEAKRLRGLPEIMDAQTAQNAHKASADAAYYAADAAYYAADADADAYAEARVRAREKFVTDNCIPVLRRMISAGPHAPMEAACSRNEFLEQVGEKQAAGR